MVLNYNNSKIEEKSNRNLWNWLLLRLKMFGLNFFRKLVSTKYSWVIFLGMVLFVWSIHGLFPVFILIWFRFFIVSMK